MAAGLELFNNNGSLLFNEHTALLRYKRKISHQSIWPPSVGSNEVLALRKTFWQWGSPATYYVFEFGGTSDNFGLQVTSANGVTSSTISEGFPKVVGVVNRYPTSHGSNETTNYTGFPSGTYAVITPSNISNLVDQRHNYSTTHVEDYMVSSTGFSIRTYGYELFREDQVPNTPHYRKTYLLVDVAGL